MMALPGTSTPRRGARVSALCFAALLSGCALGPAELVRVDPTIADLLPEYDRGAVAERRAAVLAESRPSDGYVTVGSGRDYETLGAALADAPPGVSVFYLMDPVHRSSGLLIARDASIRGFGARDTILEAASKPEEATGGVVAIAEGANVFISGVTIRGGKVTEIPRRGGGVSNSGSLVMEDCAIIENLATYGVGVWTEGRLEMRRCLVAGNVTLRRPPPDEYKAIDCGGKGAGMRVEKGGSALIEDCLIAYNEALDAGGALHVSCEGEARLVRTTLYGNSAGKRGGGVDLAGGALEMVRCTLAGNSTGGRGQAVFHRGMLSIEGCLLAGNGSGKALYQAKDKMGEFGGGIFVRDEGNFDDSGSLPLAATGGDAYLRLAAGTIRRDYGAGSARGSR